VETLSAFYDPAKIEPPDGVKMLWEKYDGLAVA
jgi:hypothetical protein